MTRSSFLVAVPRVLRVHVPGAPLPVHLVLGGVVSANDVDS